MAIFHGYVKLPEGKSYKIPQNHHFPMAFLWLSYGFPMESPKIHPFSRKKSYSESPEGRGERPAAAPRVQPEAVDLTQNQSLNGLVEGKIWAGNQPDFPMKIMGCSCFIFPLNQPIDTPKRMVETLCIMIRICANSWFTILLPLYSLSSCYLTYLRSWNILSYLWFTIGHILQGGARQFKVGQFKPQKLVRDKCLRPYLFCLVVPRLMRGGGRPVNLTSQAGMTCRLCRRRPSKWITI